MPFNKHFTNLPADTILLNDDLIDDELLLMEEDHASFKQQLTACCLRTIDILCV